MCCAVFLEVGVEQAVETVWQEGLIYKLSKMLPEQYVNVLISYICQIV